MAFITERNRVESYNNNKNVSRWPKIIYDKGWMYGVWYCGTSFQKAEMYGQHPQTYMKRLVSLFPDCIKWLHAPSGIIGHGINGERYHYTLDIVSRKHNCPQIIGNCSHLPYKDDIFDIVETDPPYGDEHCLIYGVDKYPRHKSMDEFRRVLKEGGYLCWLDIRYPRYRKTEWDFVGIFGVITGFQRVTRCLSIFKKL